MKVPLKQFDQWSQHPLGAALMQAEQAVIAEWLEGIFGYHFLQVGGESQPELLSKSSIPHQSYLAPDVHPGVRNNYIQGNFDELPLLPNSVDAILLPHVLEFCADPLHLVGEVCQSLIPEGHLIVVGFNPLSLWGISKLVSSSKKQPWVSQFFSAHKVKRWLSAHDCDVVDHKTVFFRLPLTSEAMLMKSMFMEYAGQLLWPYFGATYVMLAKKRMTTLTTIPEMKKKQRVKAVVPSINPASRVRQNG